MVRRVLMGKRPICDTFSSEIQPLPHLPESSMDTILMTEPSPFGGKEDFESRIKRVRATDKAPGSRFTRGARADSGMALGLRITTELVATIGVGVGIGLLLDSWLETKPWFLIGFILLGAIAGMFNVFRIATNQNRVVGFNQPDESGKSTPEDEGK
jgi:ATP synthase protein I